MAGPSTRPMKSFTKNPTCSKCGASAHIIHTKWYPKEKNPLVWRMVRSIAARLSPPEHLFPVSSAKEEHMSRICNGCGFSWPEIPLDQSGPLVQLAEQAL